MVQKNISAFQKVVEEANTKLKSVMTDGERTINEENTKIRNKLGTEMSKLSKDLTEQFDSSKAEMENVVGGLDDTVKELKNSTTDDYYDGLSSPGRAVEDVEIHHGPHLVSELPSEGRIHVRLV